MAHCVDTQPDELQTFLLSRGFHPARSPRVRTQAGVYEQELLSPALYHAPLGVRVYTTMEKPESGEVGTAAIGVVLLTRRRNGAVCPFSSRPLVPRVAGWEQQLAALLESWRCLLTPPCPRGHYTVLRVRHSDDRAFYGCIEFPVCRGGHDAALYGSYGIYGVYGCARCRVLHV